MGFFFILYFMKSKIEDYRGFEIMFDTDKENFYVVSNEYDYQDTKKSYPAAKKRIDDYIKDNSEFKPFYIEKLNSSCNNYSKVKVIGIRKDGRFVFEDSNGNKQQLSEYNESNYTLPNDDNEPILREIENIEFEINELRGKVKTLNSKLIRITVKDIKHKYIL